MGHVMLIGFMGAGKSTVGAMLAQRLGRAFVDLDRDIEEREEMRISEIFAHGGEVSFREAERQAVERLGSLEPSVIACGGGAVLDDENRARLKSMGTVVYLCVSAEEALARIGPAHDRPLIASGGLGAAETLLRSREALYEATADFTVPTEGRTPEEITDEIVGILTGEDG